MSKKPKIIGVIPGRYGSSRFPGKIIAKIAGKPMVQRVYEQAAGSKLLDDLIVAVDDQRVFDVVQAFGGKVMMTGKQHQSGTDRLAEVTAHFDADIYVNIQGDQPLFDPQMIDEAVAPMIDNPDMKMSTLKIKDRRRELSRSGRRKSRNGQTGVGTLFFPLTYPLQP